MAPLSIGHTLAPESLKLEPKKRYRSSETGYFILIWSCRTCNWFPESFPGPGITREELIEDMRRTLESNGIPFDEIDDGSRGKPMAAFYIDDHAIGFNENWSQISDYVSSLTL